MQKKQSSRAAVVTQPYSRSKACMAQQVVVPGRGHVALGGLVGGGGPKTVTGDGC
jgi:hypothetical protein